MCKKYPGPKCGMHLLEERKKLEALSDGIDSKFTAASEEVEAFRLALSGLAQDSGTPAKVLTKARSDYEKAIARYDRANNKKRNHDSRVRVNTLEYANTLDGILGLEALIASKEEVFAPVDAEKKQLEEAKKAYEKQVLAYDKANGTVNFKAPAENYDADGIHEINLKVKAVDKKINKLYADLITADTDEAEKAVNVKMARLEKQKSLLKNAIAHCEATQERIRMGFLPDVKGAEKLRQEAAHSIKLAQESYERSDTAGFMSQWASNSVADKNRLKAEIAENNGKSTFRALFDLKGNYVAAKEVNTRYGWAWGIFEDPENPENFSGFVNESKSKDDSKKAALLLKKGYTMGRIMAPAYVTSFGENLVSVRNIILQDFRRTRKDTIEVLTVNLYTHPV